MENNINHTTQKFTWKILILKEICCQGQQEENSLGEKLLQSL